MQTFIVCELYHAFPYLPVQPLFPLTSNNSYDQQGSLSGNHKQRSFETFEQTASTTVYHQCCQMYLSDNNHNNILRSDIFNIIKTDARETIFYNMCCYRYHGFRGIFLQCPFIQHLRFHTEKQHKKC